MSELEREREDDRAISLFNPMIGHKKKPVEMPRTSLIMTLMVLFISGGFVAMIPQLMNIALHPILFIMVASLVLFFILQMKLGGDSDKHKQTEGVMPLGS